MILLPLILFWREFLNNIQGSGDKTGAHFLLFHSYQYTIKFIFLSLAALLISSHPATASSTNPYLQDLLNKALERKLENHRYWHLLLHYKPNLSGGWTSEVDDANFFLAQDGKINPQAELQATIKSFFSEMVRGKSQQTSQCAFIARFHWLNKELKFDVNQLPRFTCEKFDLWLTELNAQGISLIFPSAYMNNPASMFGHSFLRIDQKGQTEQTKLLAYTINYAAEVPPDAGLEFAYKGIFGGYKGFFSTIPYYMKVKEYSDIENRDTWEYQLNFSEAQTHRLLMHTWELGDAYFDYYFFKENCAYHILSLLEVADPVLHLTDQFRFSTIPVDTIRLLVRQEGLIKEISYRPARSTLLKRKLNMLKGKEVQLFSKLISDPHIAKQSEFLQLTQRGQIFLLDLASDVFRYKSATDKDKAEDYQARNRSILVTRSQIPLPSAPFHVEPFSLSPEHGHETLRVGVGAGWRNNEIFEEINIRAAYHDLLDPDQGYIQDAQIELGDLGLRHYHKRNHFRIERFTFANIISLAPIDSLFLSPSWKINIGMDTVKTSSCDLCSNGRVNAGAGGALETRALH